MVNVPGIMSDLLIVNVPSSFRYSPIENQDLFQSRAKLRNLSGDRDVVEEAKSHVLIRLCVMTWWSHNRKGLLDLAAGNSKAGLNYATRTELRCVGGGGMNIER